MLNRLYLFLVEILDEQGQGQEVGVQVRVHERGRGLPQVGRVDGAHGDDARTPRVDNGRRVVVLGGRRRGRGALGVDVARGRDRVRLERAMAKRDEGVPLEDWSKSAREKKKENK